MASSNWLDRYREGQRDHVWHELRQLGSTVRESGLFEEAQLVCDEMARRARQNVEVIVERLSSEGYRFHSNDDAQTLRRPTSRRRSRRESMQIGWRKASAPCPRPSFVGAASWRRLAGRHAPAVGHVGIG